MSKKKANRKPNVRRMTKAAETIVEESVVAVKNTATQVVAAVSGHMSEAEERNSLLERICDGVENFEENMRSKLAGLSTKKQSIIQWLGSRLYWLLEKTASLSLWLLRKVVSFLDWCGKIWNNSSLIKGAKQAWKDHTGELVKEIDVNIKEPVAA